MGSFLCFDLTSSNFHLMFKKEEIGRMMEEGHQQHSSDENSLDSDLVNDIIRTVALSDGFFRHQQIGEADLTTDEKSKISSELLTSKPAVFLSRYGKFLSEEQLEYFDQLKTSNYELEYLVNQTRQS